MGQVISYLSKYIPKSIYDYVAVFIVGVLITLAILWAKKLRSDVDGLINEGHKCSEGSMLTELKRAVDGHEEWLERHEEDLEEVKGSQHKADIEIGKMSTSISYIEQQMPQIVESLREISKGMAVMNGKIANKD